MGRRSAEHASRIQIISEEYASEINRSYRDRRDSECLARSFVRHTHKRPSHLSATGAFRMFRV